MKDDGGCGRQEASAATPDPRARLVVERATLPDGRRVARYRHVDIEVDEDE